MPLVCMDPTERLSMVFMTQLLFPNPKAFPLHRTLEALLYASVV